MLYRFDGQEPTVAPGAYVSELASVIGNVEIGANCYIGHGAILRGDYGRIVIGAGSAVEEGVIIHAPPGGTNAVGEKVTIGHGAILHGQYLGDGAVVGMGAVLSILSEVGDGAIVAEGAIVKVNQKIPPGVVAAGNPAKIVRDVSSQDKELWGFGKQLYIDLAEKYNTLGMEPIDG